MDTTPPDSTPPAPDPIEVPNAPGGPPHRRDNRPSILGAILGSMAVLLASFVAFALTCVPIGCMGVSRQVHGDSGAGVLFALALIVGATTGLLAGHRAFRHIFRPR